MLAHRHCKKVLFAILHIRYSAFKNVEISPVTFSQNRVLILLTSFPLTGSSSNVKLFPIKLIPGNAYGGRIHMVRLETLSESEREITQRMAQICPSFETQPWVKGPPLSQRRVAIITTAGLHTRHDRPFQLVQGDYYRVIPGDVQANDLVMSHLSAGMDRTGYQRDWNVVFPLDRLREIAQEGIIGSVADFHYSYNSSRAKEDSTTPIREVASMLKKDKVDAVLLFPS
jgi:D-proline reductase (dithiol) PrdB